MKVNIVGRSREKIILDHVIKSNEAEFVAVYGRRRIGKTHLIRNYFISKKVVYFQITGARQSTTEIQLQRFAKEFGDTFYEGAPIVTPTDWGKAFEMLHEVILKRGAKHKIVLFFDELPWLANHKSGVVDALEYCWNHHWTHDSRIKLIVCGSSASWIIKRIVKNKDGLHNRTTQRIHLKPFTLKETEQYFEYLGFKYSHQQIIKIYMAFGGVPFYLKQLKKNKSIDQNINDLMFNVDGALFDEFDEVFASLFKNHKQYQELIMMIGKHTGGIYRTELEGKNKLTGKGGRLTKRLDDLECAGFITSYVQYGREKRGTIYRLTDEFCFFYLRWVRPVKKQLKHDNDTLYWKQCLNTPLYYNWQGYAFENICFKHISFVKQALGIDLTAIGAPWFYQSSHKNELRGAQIDLLVIQPDGLVIIVEIKFTKKKFVIDKAYAEVLHRKKEVLLDQLGSDKEVMMGMIASNGISDNLYAEEIQKVMLLDGFFKG